MVIIKDLKFIYKNRKNRLVVFANYYTVYLETLYILCNKWLHIEN